MHQRTIQHFRNLHGAVLQPNINFLTQSGNPRLRYSASKIEHLGTIYRRGFDRNPNLDFHNSVAPGGQKCTSLSNFNAFGQCNAELLMI